MDHERTEKELEEIFGEIQRSYEDFAEEAFTLQERALELARRLLEGTAGADDPDGRATLEELAAKSREERERFRTLARKASEAYLRVLKAPVDEHHHKLEEAEANLKEATSSP